MILAGIIVWSLVAALAVSLCVVAARADANGQNRVN
jgi:hypothetical protein